MEWKFDKQHKQQKMLNCKQKKKKKNQPSFQTQAPAYNVKLITE